MSPVADPETAAAADASSKASSKAVTENHEKGVTTIRKLNSWIETKNDIETERGKLRGVDSARGKSRGRGRRRGREGGTAVAVAVPASDLAPYVAGSGGVYGFRSAAGWNPYQAAAGSAAAVTANFKAQRHRLNSRNTHSNEAIGDRDK